MTTAKQILEEVLSLTVFERREVLDFVGYLKSRASLPAASEAGVEALELSEVVL